MASSYKDPRIHRKTAAGKIASGNIILKEKVFEAHLSFESVTEKCKQYQQKVESRKISVIDTLGLFDTSISEEQLKEEIVTCVEMSVPGPHVLLTTDEQINEAGKGNYHVFSNTDVENRSQVTELLEKTDKMENRGEHYTNVTQIYKEAQERSLEKEEKPGEEEPLSLTQKAAFVGAAVLGGAIGVAGAVVGGAAYGAVGLVAAPVALIAAGVSLMAEGGAITITHALKVWKEQKRTKENTI
ncbi:GTPase IMAP family member 7-like [Cyprinus carpio]|uniref:GTPase IMAP family member 7-like n=1 Tax=Cyprinus carpio TaxID=7962 RepID=A0A9Q9YI18_CYPCA|nr:GTPase IMAP family member 7-like [Cyprinus carpio]